VRERLAELGGREPEKFVLADSRERIAEFRNVCVKPNLDEFYRTQDPDVGMNGGEADLSSRTGRVVFCTRGARGIVVGRDNLPGTTLTGFVRLVPAYPVSGPIDIVGAGDSCSAGITCAMVSGAAHEQAAAFGNLVASITIRQIGVTGTASPEQVRQRWREVSAPPTTALAPRRDPPSVTSSDPGAGP
jgi:sugar/nucleoside kinase (ribokinase family)